MLIVIGLLVVAALVRLGWGVRRLWQAVPRRNEDFIFQETERVRGGCAARRPSRAR